MEKTIDTLIPDIHSLFTDSVTTVSNEDNLQTCLKHIEFEIRRALSESGAPSSFRLRASNIGLPNRKLWLQSRDEEYNVNTPREHLMFLVGHVFEAIVLFLAKEAGHTVTGEQETITREGVEGHQDAVIDGKRVDVKTVSQYSWPKFSRGSLWSEDSFGYCAQGAFYADDDEDVFSWLAFNKSTADMTLLTYDKSLLPDADERILELKKVLASDEMPETCYEPVEHDNGNVEIPTACSYCKFNKKTCWPNARVFQYSNKRRTFSKIVKEPRVREIFDEENTSDTQ